MEIERKFFPEYVKTELRKTFAPGVLQPLVPEEISTNTVISEDTNNTAATTKTTTTTAEEPAALQEYLMEFQDDLPADGDSPVKVLIIEFSFTFLSVLFRIRLIGF